MLKRSAGVLIYRHPDTKLEVLLGHPGGPFWANKDEGSWTIPKGEFTEEEEAEVAARRELEEEIGLRIEGEMKELTPVKLKSGKIIYAWAIEHDFNPGHFKSNFFEMEWPPKSGKKESFPELDSVQWFGIDEARRRINSGQLSLLNQLENLIR